MSPWLLAVPPGDAYATRQKTARKAKFGNVTRTVSCITLAGPEEEILKVRAIDPWSYATRIIPFFWLAPLPHGDMVFPTWPKMAKTAKIGRNSPHSRS